ncbi:acetylornithine deacetylase [Neptunicoccus sediminis]|uniref:acetylornithine deacetylase n=1 Tax=Neptunicoccus sediminis TaxID=1892596 RepID=UPI000845F3F5|nr:acetylornithine deacetylase [Neptunicoccus sediminis]
MERMERTLDILERLIAFPSISSESNRDLIDWIAAYLEPFGARCQITSDTDGKANLFATIGPDVDGGLILSGHTDVVPVEGQDWTADPFTLREQDGLLYGRGTCDMKGFIAAALALAPEFAAADLARPVHYAFTYDEEIGCLGARVLVDEMVKAGLKPSAAIIGEPTSMRIIEGHKGCCEYTTEFTGVEGHSSLPDLGVNALEYATRFVTKLMEIRQELPSRAPEGSRFDPPHTTLQICELHSGVAHNVIPNKAAVGWEMRPVQQSDRDFVRERIEQYTRDVLLPEMKAKNPVANIEEIFASEVAGLEPDPDSEAVAIVRALTGGNETEVVSFGTEAGLFQQGGVSAVICGPGSIEQAHKPDEYVSRDQLAACLEMLGRVAGQLR